MRRYRNLSGDSGVVAYAVDDGAIRVRFRNGDAYLYDGRRPGAAHVAAMQALAEAGRGLSSYISRHVGSDYAAKC